MGIRKEHQRYSRHVTRTKRWKTLRVEIIDRDNGQCRQCGRRGRLEVDHIKPVRTHPELSFDPANLQCLCPKCHSRKTRLECGHKPTPQKHTDWKLAVKNLEKGATSFSIPFGVQKSAIPVVLVFGPPGAGKTTYVHRNASAGDVIIDLDQFLAEIGGKPWETDKSLVHEAFKRHDAAIRGLSKAISGKAWLIKSAASQSERTAWKLALGSLEERPILTRPDTCIQRINADPKRQHRAPEMCASVHDWWRTYIAEGGEKPSKTGVTNA